MYALSLGMVRHLVRRSGVRLLRAQNPCDSDDLDSFELGEEFRGFLEPDESRFHVSLAVRYINEEKVKGVIEWGKLNNKLMEEGIENPKTKVFQACLRLNEVSTGLSYYNYLLETGQSLTAMDLLFFSKLLIRGKHEIRKYEPLLLKLFEEMKEHFLNSGLIRKFAMDVFLEIPGCFEDIIQIARNQEDRMGLSSLIQKAFEFNRPDVAFEFMTHDCFLLSDAILSKYINYCIERAKEGTFSPEIINRLVKLCQEQVICFNSCNLVKNMKTLVDGLNKYQDEYSWSVHECVFDKHTLGCSQCGQALLPKPLSKKDLQIIRDHFFETVFVKKNIYITSHKAELKKFFEFLDKSKPYDIVLDVLNLLYTKKFIGVHVAIRTLNYFLNRNYSVLLVSRIHTRTTVQKAFDAINPKLQKNIQMFFTADISDDDIFILQAALHGGLGTGFLTGDSCANHLAHMDNSVKRIFIKWQMTHQFKFSKTLQIEPPESHSGVPQLTSCVKNQKYIWHLSHQPEKAGRLSRLFNLEWVCLTATKKNERKNFGETAVGNENPVERD